jgi:hypothetical protein
MRLLLALLVALPGALNAQAVTTSPAPENVSVTIYRDRTGALPRAWNSSG